MFHDVKQNTDEWFPLRIGKVTGSISGKVMANYGKSFGEPAKRLAVEIALAQITGKTNGSNYTNEHTERGHIEEPIARMLYEDQHFCTVKNGGFFDNGFTGDSPDGLVDDEGGIEIKCVTPYVQYQRIKSGKYDSAYHWQLMFHLRESGREWFDYVSYCGGFPEDKQLWVQRLYRKNHIDDFVKMNYRLTQFEELVNQVKKQIREM